MLVFADSFCCDPGVDESLQRFACQMCLMRRCLPNIKNNFLKDPNKLSNDQTVL